MKSTKIAIYKQEALLNEMMKPFEKEVKFFELKWRKFITEIYIDLLPKEVMNLYNTHKNYLNNISYIGVYMESKFVNAYFYDEKNENDFYVLPYMPYLPNPTKEHRFTTMLKSVGVYDEALSLYNKFIEEQEKLNDIRNSFKFCIAKCDTTAKLKKEMPEAYEIYVKDIALMRKY